MSLISDDRESTFDGRCSVTSTYRTCAAAVHQAQRAEMLIAVGGRQETEERVNHDVADQMYRGGLRAFRDEVGVAVA